MLVKLVLMSILIGVVLSALGIDPRDIFQSLRRFIQNIWDMGFDAISGSGSISCSAPLS